MAPKVLALVRARASRLLGGGGAGAGDTSTVPARLRALTSCRVLEVSTPELDDVVRFEDDYGRVAAG